MKSTASRLTSRLSSRLSSVLLLATLAPACSGGTEAPIVELPVEIASEGLSRVTSDTGHDIEIDRFRVALRDIQFTIGGEVESASKAGDQAYKHPGHAQAGEVTGELPGDFVVDWTDDGAELGVASLIAGDYDAVNFTFRRADASDGLAADDPLLGHTFHIEGTADDGSGPVRFQAVLDVNDDTQMTGAPFDASITESGSAGGEGAVRLQVLLDDPFEDDTLFDGIDFTTLTLVDDGAGGARVVIAPDQTEHNILRRAAQTHDHYRATIH